MKRRRVKITGIGPVTPAGIGREAFWQGILEPVSRVRPFHAIGEKYGAFVAAHLPEFDASKHVERSLLPKAAARHTLFAVVGAILAARDAGFAADELSAANVAVVTGSSVMDFGAILQTVDRVTDRGPRGAQVRVLHTAGIGSVGSAVVEALGVRARSVSISNQCDSGVDALGYAATLVANGEAEVAVCGGTEAPLHRFPLVELRAAAMTPATADRAEQQARPFDMWRTTGVVAEGCCMFVLEPESSPRSGYAYVAGYAAAGDEPDRMCSGMTAAAKLALAQAGRRVAEVDAINAWGPGHRVVDAMEYAAMRQLFQEHLPEIATVSIKGAIGMPLGAAGAIQAGSAALGLKYGLLPPTVNWQFPDPSCAFNLSNKMRAVEHSLTLLNAHGVAGVNSSLVLERC